MNAEALETDATAIIQALRHSSGALDWDAFLNAEAAMWTAFHQGGVLDNYDPTDLPPEVELAWREAMRDMLQDTGVEQA